MLSALKYSVRDTSHILQEDVGSGSHYIFGKDSETIKRIQIIRSKENYVSLQIL